MRSNGKSNRSSRHTYDVSPVFRSQQIVISPSFYFFVVAASKHTAADMMRLFHFFSSFFFPDKPKEQDSCNNL
jgi:hypothetical protein